MGRFSQAAGQIGTRGVDGLVLPILPKETAGYVIDPSLVGNKCRCAMLPIASAKLSFREGTLLHLSSVLSFCRLASGET